MSINKLSFTGKLLSLTVTLLFAMVLLAACAAVSLRYMAEQNSTAIQDVRASARNMDQLAIGLTAMAGGSKVRS